MKLTIAYKSLVQVEMGPAQKGRRVGRKSGSGGTPPLRLSSGRIAPAAGRKRQAASGKENAGDTSCEAQGHVKDLAIEHSNIYANCGR